MVSLRQYISQVLIADLPPLQRWAYFYYSMALMIALGSYSFIVPVKQSLFLDNIGKGVEPFAKSLTLVILFPVIILYSVAVTVIQNQKYLVSAVCGVFTLIYLVVVLEMLRNETNPSHWSIWLLYYATETRSVIIMPMIWSVVNDLSTPSMSKKAYPAVFFAVQLGGILGNAMAVFVKSLGGYTFLVVLQVGVFALIAVLNWRACTLMTRSLETPGGAAAPLVAPASGGERLAVPATQGHTAIEATQGSGGRALRMACKTAYDAVEGLWLLLSRPYAFMIFWVSYATLMPRTILDYQNSILVVEHFVSKDDQVAYWGKIGVVQNCLTAALTFLGTRGIVESIGVGGSLIVLPIAMLICVSALCIRFDIWVSACACVVSSVVAYGLNSPTKEMLYVRTSREIKYKAKGWSEMYGNQLMKLFGAQVNLWVNNENPACMPHCFRPGATMMISAAWVAVWLAVALALGAQHRTLEREDRTLE